MLPPYSTEFARVCSLPLRGIFFRHINWSEVSNHRHFLDILAVLRGVCYGVSPSLVVPLALSWFMRWSWWSWLHSLHCHQVPQYVFCYRDRMAKEPGETMGNWEESRRGCSFLVPTDAALQDLGVTFYVLSMGFELGLSFAEMWPLWHLQQKQNKRIICFFVVRINNI